MITPNALPPALPGWYPDPTGVPGHRYHDGQVWTAHFTPAPQQPLQQPAERRFTIHYGFALLAVFSLIGTLVPSIFWFVAVGGGASEPGTDPHVAAGTVGFGTVLGVIWLLWGGMWTLVWTAFAIQHTLKGRRR
jgi:hypothetical protein